MNFVAQHKNSRSCAQTSTNINNRQEIERVTKYHSRIKLKDVSNT